MKVVVKDLAQKKFEVDIEPTDTVSHLFPPLSFLILPPPGLH